MCQKRSRSVSRPEGTDTSGISGVRGGYNAGMKSAGLLLLALFFGVVSEAQAAGPASGQPGFAPGYVDSVNAWRARRLARLTSDTGWLTIAGLHWLEGGKNVLGSDPGARVQFPAEASAAKVGVIQLRWNPAGLPPEMELNVVPGVDIMRDSVRVTRERVDLDAEGSSPVYSLGRLRFWIIKRGERYAVRVRDPESSLRKDFAGIQNYAVDPAMCVVGRLEGARTHVLVPNIAGYLDSMLTPGVVTFAVRDTVVRLTPVLEDPSDSTTLFFIFQDKTSGIETYGGGRFLYADLEPGGRVVLDFNKAYNPPCAFNPHTTCPLPPEGNVLPIAIQAGEKSYAGSSGHAVESEH